MSWQCKKCGSCCRFVFKTPLDRGDGVCKHLEEDTNLCKIYDNRPDICKVELFDRKPEELQDACTKLRKLREAMKE